MKASVRWLHDYLVFPSAPAGGGLSPKAIDELLTDLGLPIDAQEGVQTAEGPDTWLEVEITSNRGDCMSHRGLARELVTRLADKGVALKEFPAAPGGQGEPVASQLSLTSSVGGDCPRFIARVIKGVKVGPSPAWLAARLEAIGQRPINNVVDVTNFVLFELGNPCHAFDLAKLAGRKLDVRVARAKEQLVTLDGNARTLRGGEVVICDGQGPTSLAGIMGGLASSVTGTTTDIVLEMATWDPVKVRTAARLHQLRTSASSRYERIVDSRTLEAASLRACELILHVAGGALCEGSLDIGAPAKQATTITLRPSKVSGVLGIDVDPDTIVRCLQRLEVGAGPLGRGGEALLCTVPAHRPDLTREIDLIEEVARLVGFDKVPAKDRVLVPVQPAQHDELARRNVANALAAAGFFETVTFSFATPKAAALSVHTGLEPIVMDDARRGDEPALRASPLTGLLAARQRNQNAGATQAGGVRLFELASAFAQTPLPAPSKLDDHSVRSVERGMLCLLMDAPGTKIDQQREGVRLLRGAVEAVVRACTGDVSDLRVTALQAGENPLSSVYDERGCARLGVRDASGNTHDLGALGLASKAAMQMFALDAPVLIAELRMDALVAAGPVRSKVVVPPSFPSIERDVSFIVDERVGWAQMQSELQALSHAPLENATFVTTFRGPQVGEGKKSVTVRLAYRDASRTLTHAEIDGPVQDLLRKLREKIPFEIRS